MRRYSLIIVVVCISVYMCGCASLIARPQQVILLPEERIFTVPAGQNISVNLDKKPMSMTFPYDMKLVSPTVLVRQEEKLNNEILKSAKASKDNSAKLGVMASVFGILATILGAFFRKKLWPSVKFNAEVK
jgi:hypothetical protein